MTDLDSQIASAPMSASEKAAAAASDASASAEPADTIGLPVPAPPAEAASGQARRPLPFLTTLVRALGILALAGWSCGILIATLALKNGVERLVSSVATGARPGAGLFAATMVPVVVAVLAGGAAYLTVFRQRGGVERLLALAKRCSPLCLIGFVPYLFHWQAWVGRELTFLFLAALFSLVAWAVARAALPAPRAAVSATPEPRAGGAIQFLRDLLAGRRWPAAPTLVVIAGAAGYAALFAKYTITFHRNLRTAAYDLGLEDNLVYNVLHGHGFFRSTPFSGPGGSHFGNHATFFSYVLAPFYRLSQGAHTLLLIQAILIGAAAIPLYGFARRHVSPWSACLIALFYLLYAPVHGANLYEFHYLPLGAFFLFSSLFLLEARRDRLAILAVILTLSVREDVGAALAVVGAYLLMSGSRPRAGAIVATIGALHFVLLKLFVMPRVGGGESFVMMYKDLLPAGEQTYEGMMKTVVGNPTFMLGTLIEREKLYYLLQLFVPLAFVPFRRPIIILLLVPGFFFTLLSTGYYPLIQTSFQYTFHWTVFLFIGLVAALAQPPDQHHPAPEGWLRRNQARLFAIACALLPTSYQFGAVFQRHTARGGFTTFYFDTTPKDLADRAEFERIRAELPPHASVAASDNLVPQISNRPIAYTLRFSIFDADYVLFFTDPARIDGSERQKVTDALLDGSFGVVDVRPPYGLARRGHDTALNDRVLLPWGMHMPPAPPAPAPAP